MKCLIINNNTKFLDKLIALLANYNPIVVDYKKFSINSISDFDFLVLSGGSINISYPNNLKKIKKFLRKTNKPILGICLGLQILSITFSSTLLDLKQQRKGFFDFDFFGAKGSLYYIHSCFIKDVPEEFEILVKSGDIIELIKHKIKPLVGLQGHPEMSNEYGKKIINLFVDKFVKLNQTQ